MRTLRKGLAMLLAVVMVLGLGVFNAFALTSRDYLDGGDIDETYKEAVDVLSYLGVLTGFDDDGDGEYEFMPAQPLTRGQAATVVCRLLGVTNPSGRSSFADGDWADPFIGYMEQYNITNGISLPGEEPKLYGTNNYLTGYQFAKFLLVALGYDPDIEGMTGQGWEFGVQKLLNRTNLDGKLPGSYNLNTEITREMAMQMALNALETPMVEYTGGVTIGDVKVGSERQYITSGAGYATHISDDGDGSANAYVELGEYYWRSLQMDSSDTDDMGRPGKVWSYGGKDIGTYGDSSALVESWTTPVSLKTMQNAIGKSAVANIGTAKNTLTVYVDGNRADKTTSGKASYAADDDKNDVLGSGHGILTELYKVEQDGDTGFYDYTIVISNTYLVKANADYSATSKSVRVSRISENGQSMSSGNLPTEIKAEDFPIAAGVKKDDYLLVTFSAKGDGSIQTVAYADVLTGEVDSYARGTTKVKDYTVTIDGTKYNYNGAIGVNGDKGAKADYEVGKNATVVLDSYGYVLYVDEVDAESSGNYLYITEAQKGMNGTQARAYFLDGAEEEITLKNNMVKTADEKSETDILGINGGSGNYNGAVDTWFKYSLSGGKYKLTMLDTTKGTFDNSYNSSAAKFMKKGDVAFLSAAGISNAGAGKTIVLILDKDGDVTRLEGVDHLADVSAKKESLVKIRYTLDGTYLKYVFIDGNVEIDDAEKNEDLLFVLEKKDSGKDSRGEFTTFKVLLNGAEATVDVEKDSVTAFEGYAGTLVTGLKYNDKGLLTEADPWGTSGKKYTRTGVTGAGSAVATSNGDILTLGTVSLNTAGANMFMILGEDVGSGDTLVKKANFLNTSVNEIVTTLKGANIDLDWYAKYANNHEGNYNSKITDLYIYVEKLTTVQNSTKWDVSSEEEFRAAAGATQDKPATINVISAFSIVGEEDIDITNQTVVLNYPVTNKAATVNFKTGSTLKTAGAGVWVEECGDSLHFQNDGKATDAKVQVKTGGKVEIDSGNSGTFAFTRLAVEGGEVVIDDGAVTITDLAMTGGAVEITGNADSAAIGTAAVGSDATLTVKKNLEIANLTLTGTLEIADSVTVKVTTKAAGTGGTVKAAEGESGTGSLAITAENKDAFKPATDTGNFIAYNGTITLDIDPTLSSTISLSMGSGITEPNGDGVYVVAADVAAGTVAITWTGETEIGKVAAGNAATTALNTAGVVTWAVNNGNIEIKVDPSKASGTWAAVIKLNAAAE